MRRREPAARPLIERALPIVLCLRLATVVAADAHTAQSLLEMESATNLPFTGLGLPNGVSGRQLADELRRRWPSIKVLFAMSDTRNAIAHHGRLDPDVDLIAKSFTQSGLASEVRRVLDGGAQGALRP